MESDVEKDLFHVKKQLKSWEAIFVSDNKRKPNKVCCLLITTILLYDD